MRQQRRDPTDRAGFSFDVEQRKITFRGGVEFEDLRNRKPPGERLPDVAAQSVADGQPQPVSDLQVGRRRLQQVAAKLADILEDRAVETHDVAPKIRGGKFLRDRDGTARAEHAAGRDHTAHGMMERQAIVEAVVDGRVGQPGKPSAPGENAAMTDVRRLRQPGGAGSVDQERALVDRDVAAFGGGQRVRVRGGE